MPLENPRRVCFVTGTRAEFGLMRSVLSAIAENPALRLQIVATGMHLDRSRGRSLDAIRSDGWTVDAVIPWPPNDGSEAANAIATGKAIAAMAARFATLQSDIILVAGDRVEAFAAAAAAHLCGCLVAHVHGGDRALGLVDDSLRHAITKLAHIHFPATKLSAERIERMGENRWRIFRAGSPGLDEVREIAAPADDIVAVLGCAAGTATVSSHQKRSRVATRNHSPKSHPSCRFAMLVLHPQSTDAREQRNAARMTLRATLSIGFDRILIVYPNNDPGSDGIAQTWDELPSHERIVVRRDIPRPLFLGLLRDAAVLVGNSSSGIIEAASFGTPVLDIGTRQAGRERGVNVIHAPMKEAAIVRGLRQIWNDAKPIRFTPHNIYGGDGAGQRIARVLSRISPSRFFNKLIAF